MPRKGKCKKKPSASITTVSVSKPPASIPPSELPPDIILSILKLLPVKSLVRFKCVCREWLSLLSTPKFISIHCEETAKNPLNHSFIIHSDDPYDLDHEMSLLNVNYPETELVSQFNPFHWMLEPMVVGSINGLVCLALPFERIIILWNPAMNLYKVISLPIPDERTYGMSPGFAYDSVNDDYKILRIDLLTFGLKACLTYRAEVYSANLDSWKRVQIDVPSDVSIHTSSVIVKGIPYWTVDLHETINKVLVYYDMPNGSVKHLPLPYHDHDGREQYVEWKGNLGRIVCRGDFVDIWVYDEMGAWWNKISSHGPIGLNMGMPRQCSKNGVILAEPEQGRLMLYDPVTNWIKELFIPGALEGIVEAFTYTESLVTINGMEKVEEQDKDKS